MKKTIMDKYILTAKLLNGTLMHLRSTAGKTEYSSKVARRMLKRYTFEKLHLKKWHHVDYFVVIRV